jgi:integrase
MELTVCNIYATLSRMKTTPSRSPKPKAAAGDSWPRKVRPGRAIVTVYRRKTPVGNFAYMVANYLEDGTRRFDSYSSEAEALEAAETLANRLDRRDYVAASMTKAQAIEYANAVKRLEPFNVSVDAATAAVAEALKTLGELPKLHAAVAFYAARHKRITPKPVADVVAELLTVKASRGGSERYLSDLRLRLGRFAQDCVREAHHVTTADVQAWVDGLGLAPQTYTNFRRVLNLLFEFAVARGYASDNPVEGVERVKVRGGDVEIFTPQEIARLLAAASPEFMPCIAIGAFAGLRSAEIERLEWGDVDLTAKHIVVGAARAKTATRRIVPLHDNLAAWLAPYAGRKGAIWTGGHDGFYAAQQATAASAGLTWKANALRHSYGSYRFAQLMDAGRVAGEMGNSAAVVHRHYRELVKPADAERWFTIRPEAPANLLTLPAATTTGEAVATNAL